LVLGGLASSAAWAEPSADPTELLWTALQARDFSGVSAAVQKGADLRATHEIYDAPQAQRFSLDPLYYAGITGQIQAVELLLKRGAWPIGHASSGTGYGFNSLGQRLALYCRANETYLPAAEKPLTVAEREAVLKALLKAGSDFEAENDPVSGTAYAALGIYSPECKDPAPARGEPDDLRVSVMRSVIQGGQAFGMTGFFKWALAQPKFAREKLDVKRGTQWHLQSALLAGQVEITQALLDAGISPNTRLSEIERKQVGSESWSSRAVAPLATAAGQAPDVALALVRALLKAGAKLEDCDYFRNARVGRCPIDYAFGAGNLAVADELISRGANLERDAEWGPLSELAARQAPVDVFARYLAQIHRTSNYGAGPLLRALGVGLRDQVASLDLARFILQQKLYSNQVRDYFYDIQACEPLSCVAKSAAWSDSTAITRLKLLIEEGYRVDDLFAVALPGAQRYDDAKRVEWFQWLTSQGYKPNARELASLSRQIYASAPEAFLLLAEAFKLGCEVNPRDALGVPLLEQAFTDRRWEFATQLLRAGADPRARKDSSSPPLLYRVLIALDSRNFPLVCGLAAGSKEEINWPTPDQHENALFLAMKSDLGRQSIPCLLKAGAQPDFRNLAGQAVIEGYFAQLGTKNFSDFVAVQLINGGVPVDFVVGKDAQTRSFLQAVITQKRPAVAAAVIQHAKELDYIDPQGGTAYTDALAVGDFASASQLIKAKYPVLRHPWSQQAKVVVKSIPDPNTWFEWLKTLKATPGFSFSTEGDYLYALVGARLYLYAAKAFDLGVPLGANVDQARAAVMQTVQTAPTDLVPFGKALLAQLPNLDYSIGPYSPLTYALTSNARWVLPLLDTYKANPRYRVESDGKSAIFALNSQAASRTYLDVLLQHGANVNDVTAKGQSVLWDLVGYYGKQDETSLLDYFELLVKKGADVNLLFEGKSLVALAVERQWPRLALKACSLGARDPLCTDPKHFKSKVIQ
jgi:ankyrin repeat protein